jgi:hypothetical protein
MKKLLRFISALTFVFSFFGGATNAIADTTLAPSATFTLEVTAVTMLDGESALPVSKGVVTYQGKQYPFTIQAVSMGNRFGTTTLKGTGVLYGMKDISQFASPFFFTSGGIHPVEANDVVTLTNKNGVIAVMSGTVTTVPLWIPATGVIVQFTKN